jgi:hypothetical protein
VSLRVKVNNMLLVAHDITLGKDFRLFFQVTIMQIFLFVVYVILLLARTSILLR